MQIHNVHSREIDAPADTVGDLLDAMGRGGGRLWPIDRWPTAPMSFNRHLEVGSHGGHGSIRYAVEEYEPGRSVVFRFTPEMALDGIHRLDVQPLGPRRTRLIHTLDVGVRGQLRLVKPVLLGYHDSMIEDLLARADHAATGAPLDYPHVPRWLRVLNAAETGWWRWREKLPPAMPAPERQARSSRPAAATVGGRLVPPVLLALGGLHGLWALGCAWPAGSREDLAHWVLGDGASVPPAAACWAVTALLAVGAGGVQAAAHGARSRHVPPLAWATASALLVRGAIYPPIDLSRGLAFDYDRIDLLLYSPLCLLLGLGALAVARDLPRLRSIAPVDGRIDRRTIRA